MKERLTHNSYDKCATSFLHDNLKNLVGLLASNKHQNLKKSIKTDSTMKAQGMEFDLSSQVHNFFPTEMREKMSKRESTKIQVNCWFVWKDVFILDDSIYTRSLHLSAYVGVLSKVEQICSAELDNKK